MTGLRRVAAAPITVLAILVAAGVWVQVYLAASHIFGAGDAIDAHKDIGWIVHTVELLILLLALIAWTDKRRILLALGLAVIGTVQIMFSGSDEWVGGVHGLLALAVLTIAVMIVKPHGPGSPSAVQPHDEPGAA
jgi:hypothetical protein